MKLIAFLRRLWYDGGRRCTRCGDRAEDYYMALNQCCRHCSYMKEQERDERVRQNRTAVLNSYSAA